VTEAPERPAGPSPSWWQKWWFLVVLTEVYAAFLAVPVGLRWTQGRYFGWDAGQYLLTASVSLHQLPNPYTYPFPLLPAAYVPVVLAAPSLLVEYALVDVLSLGLVIGLFLAIAVLGFRVTDTRLGSALGAVAVGTYALIPGEIGLGNQAQLCAFLLGAIALGLQFRRVSGTDSGRRDWVVGGLLALACLSEPYSASYFVMASVLVAGIFEVAPRRPIGVAMRLVRVGGPAAATLVALLAWDGAQFGFLATRPIAPYLLHGTAWMRGWSEVGFGSPIDLVGYLGLLAGFALYATWGRGVTSRARVLLVATTIPALLEVLAITPVTYWNRAEYFLAFPLAAVVISLAPAAVVGVRTARAVWSRPSAARTLDLRRARTRWLDLAVCALLVGVLLGQSAVAGVLYPAALRQYEVDPTGLEEITWLRSQSGAALVTAPPGEMLSVANAIVRPIFPATQPVWFDRSDQQNRAIEGTLLSSATRWISGGPLVVADTDPSANASSPTVFLDRFPYFVSLLAVTEGIGVPFGPGYTEAATSEVARPVPSPPSPEFTDVDQFAGLTASKSTTMVLNDSVWVNFTFESAGPSFSGAHVELRVPEGSAEFSLLPGTGIGIVDRFGFAGNPVVKSSASARLSVPANVELAREYPSGPDRGASIGWSLTPGAGFSGRWVNASLILHVQGTGTARPALTSEATELTGDSIEWAVVDTSLNPWAAGRFQNDSEFDLYYTGAQFSVFAVR